MLKLHSHKKGALALLVAASLGLAACSSNDDDDITDILDGDDEVAVVDPETDPEEEVVDSELNASLVTLELELDSASTVPPANVDGASGTGSVSVDTETGAIAGSVTVSGTTGPATAAHVHQGAVGEAGPVLVGMVASDDSTVWTIAEGEALDAAGIQAFNDGLLYINVHTEANAAGELRVQLVEAVEPVAAAGSVTFEFRNLSESQPMTPPNVILHNAPDAENGVRFFQVGASASGEVIAIAEDGMIMGLEVSAQGQINATPPTASASGIAAPEAGGPLLPGSTSSITLMPELADQVVTIVSMVVCTNDGFSGADSMAIEEGTFTLPIYDAGSETNVLTLDYWVPPCGSEANLTDDENGAIAAHPGQTGSENPVFDFAPGTELLEVTVTINQ